MNDLNDLLDRPESKLIYKSTGIQMLVPVGVLFGVMLLFFLLQWEIRFFEEYVLWIALFFLVSLLSLIGFIFGLAETKVSVKKRRISIWSHFTVFTTCGSLLFYAIFIS